MCIKSNPAKGVFGGQAAGGRRGSSLSPAASEPANPSGRGCRRGNLPRPSSLAGTTGWPASWRCARVTFCTATSAPLTPTLSRRGRKRSCSLGQPGKNLTAQKKKGYGPPVRRCVPRCNQLIRYRPPAHTKMEAGKPSDGALFRHPGRALKPLHGTFYAAASLHVTASRLIASTPRHLSKIFTAFSLAASCSEDGSLNKPVNSLKKRRFLFIKTSTFATSVRYCYSESKQELTFNQ